MTNDDRTPHDAAAALDAITRTRTDVATRVGSPPHYYTRLGIATALLIGAQADALPTVASLAAILVACVLLGWAVRSYITHTGTWTMATLREPGAWMAWLMIVVMIGSLAAATITHDVVVCAVGAVASIVATSVLGPRWDAAWVRSMERQA